MLDIEYPCRRKMCNRGRLSASYDWTRSFHVPAGNSIHGDKDRHLPCACAALRLEQMPDFILFRDCTALFLFLSIPFYCYFRFIWCRSVKSGIFDFNVVLWLSCISGRPFSSDAYLSLVGQLELLAKINVWKGDIRVDPEKSPLCE